MVFDLATLIGTAAATLTTLCFVPQVVKIIRTRCTESISLSMYIIFAIGVALWFSYGLMIGSYPMIISNFITLLLVIIILVLKLRE
jgi:MtN3 and saliva related transmembrane protein